MVDIKKAFRRVEIRKSKGRTPPMLGKHHSESTKRKISESTKGLKPSDETREKMSIAKRGKPSTFKGKKHTEESNYKNRLKHLGKETWNKGIAFTQIAGDKHYNWKGGTTPETMRIRNSVKIQNWRRSVFERDKHTCQDCEVVGGYLHAHHIKSFAEFLESRFDVDNGITLCKTCHWRKHGRF